mmetsp:Transcript_52789/g.94233  ORF Transcript_52789/g.94233 Transcript_52789/m.94233 type:complete len:239 (-) Transcript_52789:83-799(-)
MGYAAVAMGISNIFVGYVYARDFGFADGLPEFALIFVCSSLGILLVATIILEVRRLSQPRQPQSLSQCLFCFVMGCVATTCVATTVAPSESYHSPMTLAVTDLQATEEDIPGAIAEPTPMIDPTSDDSMDQTIGSGSSGQSFCNDPRGSNRSVTFTNGGDPTIIYVYDGADSIHTIYEKLSIPVCRQTVHDNGSSRQIVYENLGIPVPVGPTEVPSWMASHFKRQDPGHAQAYQRRAP